MLVLRESPWYQEILEEGREQGLVTARREDLLRVLAHRFGDVPTEVESVLRTLHLGQLEQLFDLALDVATLDEFRTHLPPATAESDGDIGLSQPES